MEAGDRVAAGAAGRGHPAGHARAPRRPVAAGDPGPPGGGRSRRGGGPRGARAGTGRRRPRQARPGARPDARRGRVVARAGPGRRGRGCRRERPRGGDGRERRAQVAAGARGDPRPARSQSRTGRRPRAGEVPRRRAGPARSPGERGAGRGRRSVDGDGRPVSGSSSGSTCSRPRRSGSGPARASRLVRWGGEGALAGLVRQVDPSAFTKVSALGIEEQRVYVLVDPVAAGLGAARRRLRGGRPGRRERERGRSSKFPRARCSAATAPGRSSRSRRAGPGCGRSRWASRAGTSDRGPRGARGGRLGGGAPRRPDRDGKRVRPGTG